MSETTGITVTGVGTVEAAPDTATANLGVSVLAPTAEEASTAAAKAAKELIGALTAAGVDRSDIRTVDYSLAAEYEWTDQGRRDLGYRAQNTVRARMREVGNAGTVIDAVVAAAGDAVTINGLEFTIADRSSVEAQARDAAWADAMARATQLGQLAGVTLGAPIEVVEVDTVRPMPMMRLAAMEAARSTPVEAGALEVTASIRARFQIN